MSSNRKIGIRKSIATRLLKNVFGYYVFFALVVTIMHMVVEYNYQKENIAQDLTNVRKAFERNIAINLWQLNQEALETVVKGILEIPIVSGIRIQNEKGKDIVIGGVIPYQEQVGNVGIHINISGLSKIDRAIHKTYNFDLFHHSFPIIYIYENKEKLLGEVTFYSNSSVIYRRVKLGFLMLIINAVLKTAALWFIFLIFATYLLRRPLVAFSEAASKITLEKLASFRVNVITSGRNELKLLEESFNSMIVNLHKSIIERQQAEKSMHESEQRYSTLVHNIPGVSYRCAFDEDFTIDFISAEIEKLTGYPATDFVQNRVRTFASIIHSDDIQMVIKEVNLAVTQKKDYILEYRLICANGVSCWVFDKGTGIFDESGNVQFLDGVAIDITKRKKAEQSLAEAHEELEQKVIERTKALQQEIDERKQVEMDLLTSQQEAEFANQAKSEFLSNISHEIRTPMHQILSYSKFGVDKINKVKKDKHLHYFSKINFIGKNLLSLLNDLLDLSKLESGKLDYKMERTDLKRIIENVSNEFVSLVDEKGVALELPQNNLQSEIVCDESKISQVIRNLLSNAIKFTPPNHKINVSIEEDKLVAVGDDQTIPALLIRISDQGVGIPEDELKSVFDKFIQSSTTKTGAGGTGLGLAICKEILEAHNGKIWAENNAENGSTFSFLLPYE